MDDLGEMEVRMDLLGHYGFLQQSTDMTDPHYNQLLRILDQLEADYNAELAKYRAQIMDNDNETLDAVSDKRPDLGAAIREFKRIKKHRLSSEVESALSSIEPTLSSFEGIYTTCRAADMSFPDFEVDGKTYPLSFVLYENSYQYNPDHKLRHAAFKAFSKVLNQYKNTVAANYYAQVSKEKTWQPCADTTRSSITCWTTRKFRANFSIVKSTSSSKNLAPSCKNTSN